MIDWLNYLLNDRSIDWLIDWLIELFIEWSIDWMIELFIEWSIDWMIELFIEWSIRLIDWLINFCEKKSFVDSLKALNFILEGAKNVWIQNIND